MLKKDDINNVGVGQLLCFFSVMIYLLSLSYSVRLCLSLICISTEPERIIDR